uniref:Uncharacterized protein n=1 Tax=viral metagenome TaxID=1070528 RepID=A0A6M3KA67_9ZZZZ
MGTPREQQDSSFLLRYGKRNGKHLSPWHRWLRRAYHKFVRREAKAALRAGEEPPRKSGYEGWET